MSVHYQVLETFPSLSSTIFFFTEHLEVGIPLPKILNVNFANSEIAIIEVSFLPGGCTPDDNLCLERHVGHV